MIACMIPEYLESFRCVPGVLVYIWISLTRLETRTKECNACASIRD